MAPITFIAKVAPVESVGTLIAGCFAVRKPGHQAFHDRVAGTAVFRTSELSSRRGFAPLVAQKVESVESAQSAEMAETR